MQNGLEHSLHLQENGLSTSTNGHESPTNADVHLTNGLAAAHNSKVADVIDDFHNGEPPSKKRKLVEEGDRLRSTPRPISPPWKRVIVEGPTSFVEEGKRRSARTNVVPLELRPPSAKRQTRAANHLASSSSVKSKFARSNMTTSLPSPSATTPTQTHSRPQRASGRFSQSASNKKPSAKPQPSPKSQIHPTPSKRPYHRRVSSVSHRPPSTPVQPTQYSPPAKRGPGRPRKNTVQEHTSVVAKPRQKKEDTEEESDEEAEAEDDASDSIEEDESMDDLPVDPNFKPQRLRFKVKMPTLSAQHPANIPKVKKHASLRDWVEEVAPFEGSDPRLSEHQIKKEARSRLRLAKAAEPGGILSGTCSLDIPEPEEEPPRQYFRHDHLLAHAQDMHRRMAVEKRKHMRWAKKIADDLIAYWEELQPKSEETIKREKEEAMEVIASAVMRQCIHDLSHKWELLRAEVDRQRLKKWEEEQEALGKQALNKVLEHSSHLLDARRHRDLSELDSDNLGSDSSDTDSDDGLENSEPGSEGSDERNMSSNGSGEDEESEIGAHNEDDNLTAEELRLKYAANEPTDQELVTGSNAEVVSLKDTPNQEPEGGEPEANFEISQMGSPQQLSGPGDGIQKQSHQPSKSLFAEEMCDSMLDESDKSTDMDDDMGDSDEGASDEGSEESDNDSSQESEDAPGGLLGFFSKDDLAISGATEQESSRIEELQDQSEEEIDEVSLIPDATQVQTPSASNSDVPSVRPIMVAKLADEPESVPRSRLSGLQEPSPTVDQISDVHDESVCTLEQKPIESESMQITTTTQVVDSPRDSLPATPLSSKPLKTPVPSLLRGTLREYQHYGLDWLAGLYANQTNGILADEMGLGKTIQTISLLAHLAVDRGVWGPHLIVVPTSVMLNWEMEFKKFLPGFKILTYYGSQEERKQKRKGWLADDKWNVVITSYQLVLQDQASFKKRAWHYLVLDEAHNIKNFRSQRWQALLGFRSAARLLLTGTPLQNNLTELWSLLFFLMPSDSRDNDKENETVLPGFADLQAFTSWFKKPVDQILEQGRETMDDEAKEIVRRLHEVLRPYLLRRLKADVEKQMPGKYEHVVYCKLSKRQRYLYDGFMSRAATRETLASGNYLSIINCLMQLRKVCNHPDLFETRPIVTSFAMPRSAVADYEIKELLVRRRLLHEAEQVSLDVVDLLPGANGPVSALDTIQPSRLGGIAKLRQLVAKQRERISPNMAYDGSSTPAILSYMDNNRRIDAKDDLHHRVYLTSLRSQRRPLMSYTLIERLKVDLKPLSTRRRPSNRSQLIDWFTSQSEVMEDMVVTLPRRAESMQTALSKFACITPAVVAPEMNTYALSPQGVQIVKEAQERLHEDPFHEARMRLSIAFPDKRLLQYDCGKLQKLDALLRNLQSGGHRALIFTQMTKVLDILEQFLNIHGHRYLRLDGSTKIEQRQILTDRFNNDPRILVFILSSRSGGLGINLTGADSVIFYDLDWNPAMDKQCQDRAHRIGQTRDVHIYRFVSEYTIEANILRKANQKRMLDDVVIQQGEFTTDFFHKTSQRDTPEDESMREADPEASAAMDRILGTAGSAPGKLSTRIFEQAEDKEDIDAAKIAQKEVEIADEGDFLERPGNSLLPKSPGGSLTPSGNVSAPPNGSTTPATEDDSSPEFIRGVVAPRTETAMDIFAEKEAIGVDRYMVEHVEWELKDVPIGPPPGEKKKKKRGDHIVTRKR